MQIPFLKWKIKIKVSGNNKNEENTGGRPTKESQGEAVTEKTIQNQESQN